LRLQLAESRQAESLIQREKKFYQYIATAVRQPLVLLDSDLQVLGASPSFYDTFLITSDEAEGRLFYELGGRQWDIPKLRGLLEQVLTLKIELHDFELDHDFLRVGHKRLLLNAQQVQQRSPGKNLVLLTIDDITERRAAEKALLNREHRLRESSRLAALGLLAGGMAHGLNNPLGVIMGFSELALNEVLSPKVERYIQTVYSETERAARIIRNVLSFARGIPLTQTNVAVPTILERVIGLKSQELADANISVITQFSPDLPMIAGDPFQLIAALLNIITNAQQAMAKASVRGELTIRAYQVEDKIRISIEDNGPGILPEHLDRIFDPFFTTKEVGKGTGLGLSLAYGVIRQHGGELWAESVVGAGSTFHIELPLSSYREGEALDPMPVATDVLTKQVLVVNDEPDFRELLTIALSSEGYLVEQAEDWVVAWDMVRRQVYDGIILDLQMPGMGGQRLYWLIKDYDSTLAQRCIFITGAVLNSELLEFIAAAGNPLLNKPFSLQAIIRLVSEL
jgi:two-component system NtrC family sensor kinase